MRGAAPSSIPRTEMLVTCLDPGQSERETLVEKWNDAQATMAGLEAQAREAGQRLEGQAREAGEVYLEGEGRLHAALAVRPPPPLRP